MIQINISGETSTPWFKSWFNSPHYHRLYSHRNDTEAAAFIDMLFDELNPAPGSAMLDLGCGAGRHSRYLASKGFRVTGIDLSLNSIRHAKKYETGYLKFIRSDMRTPFGRNRYDFVFNFFTSFGYFKTDAENDIVIRNISDSLKNRGRLILDYLNINYAEKHLKPFEEKEIDGIIYNIERWTDERNFYKKISVKNDIYHLPAEYTERVSKLSLNAFSNMFIKQDLKLKDVYGDYKLSEYDPETSPRMILVAEKIPD